MIECSLQPRRGVRRHGEPRWSQPASGIGSRTIGLAVCHEQPADPAASEQRSLQPRRELVVTAGDDGEPGLGLSSTSSAPVVLRASADPLTSAAFSPDGKLVVTSDLAGTTRVWDAESGTIKASLREPLSGQTPSAAFSPDGELVVTASVDGTARLWDWAATPPRIVTRLTPVIPHTADRRSV